MTIDKSTKRYFRPVALLVMLFVMVCGAGRAHAENIFKDTFTADPKLNDKKWEYSKIWPEGYAATYQKPIVDFLKLTVKGRSCGSCGIGDGSRLIPKINPVDGDFAVDLQFVFQGRSGHQDELYRSGVNLSVLANVDDPVSRIATMTLSGDYLNDGTPFHGVDVGFFDGAGNILKQVMTPLPHFDPGTWLAMRIERRGQVCKLGIKTLDLVVVHEDIYKNCSLAPIRPVVEIWSGDGGQTQVNGTILVDFDYLTVTR